MKHRNLIGNRVTTGINLHSRTLDILKHIKKHRNESNIMSIFDALFSISEGKRDEALAWLADFNHRTLPHAFSFEDGHWTYALAGAPDPNYPVIPEEDKEKYFFNDKGEVEFYPAYKAMLES